MKVVVGMATMPGREKYLQRAIASLDKQVDEIYLYDNGVSEDLTDNGKFWGLTQINEPCYYFTCDDDIIYPHDYVQVMVSAIESFNGNCVVTHHGRQLLGLDRPYYKGHKSFRCLGSVVASETLDVLGSGVSAFRTDRINPVGIHLSEHKRMSDLVFSLWLAENKVCIKLIPHESGWLKDLGVPEHLTCYGMEVKSGHQQMLLANEIYNLNHGDKTTKG